MHPKGIGWHWLSLLLPGAGRSGCIHRGWCQLAPAHTTISSTWGIASPERVAVAELAKEEQPHQLNIHLEDTRPEPDRQLCEGLFLAGRDSKAVTTRMSPGHRWVRGLQLQPHGLSWMRESCCQPAPLDSSSTLFAQYPALRKEEIAN